MDMDVGAGAVRYTGSAVCRRCGASLPDEAFPKRPSGHRGFVCRGCLLATERRPLDRDREAKRVAAAKAKAAELMAEPTKTCKRCGETKPNNTANFQLQVFLAKGVYVTADTCKACKGAAVSYAALQRKFSDEAYGRFKATGEVGETLLQRLDRERLERERIAAARTGGTEDEDS